jgi:hypothetical protein
MSDDFVVGIDDFEDEDISNFRAKNIATNNRTNIQQPKNVSNKNQPKLTSEDVKDFTKSLVETAQAGLEGAGKGSFVMSFLDSVNKYANKGKKGEPDWFNTAANFVGNIGVPAYLGGVAGSIGGPVGIAAGAAGGALAGEAVGTITSGIIEALKKIVNYNIPDSDKADLIKTIVDIGVPLGLGAVAGKAGVKELRQFVQKYPWLPPNEFVNTIDLSAKKLIPNDPLVKKLGEETINDLKNMVLNKKYDTNIKASTLSAGLYSSNPEAVKNVVNYIENKPEATLETIQKLLYKNSLELIEEKENIRNSLEIAKKLKQTLPKEKIDFLKEVTGLDLDKFINDKEQNLKIYDTIIDTFSQEKATFDTPNIVKQIKELSDTTDDLETRIFLDKLKEAFKPFVYRPITPQDLIGVKRNLVERLFNPYNFQTKPVISANPPKYWYLTDTGKFLAPATPATTSALEALLPAQKEDIKKSK